MRYERKNIRISSEKRSLTSKKLTRGLEMRRGGGGGGSRRRTTTRFPTHVRIFAADLFFFKLLLAGVSAPEDIRRLNRSDRSIFHGSIEVERTKARFPDTGEKENFHIVGIRTRTLYLPRSPRTLTNFGSRPAPAGGPRNFSGVRAANGRTGDCKQLIALTSV